MASPRERLTEAESNRIYQEEIRPIQLGGLTASTTPTLVLVGGPPGSGHTVLAPRLGAELASRSGTPLVFAVDDLREHHPAWLGSGQPTIQTTARVDADAARWAERLLADAIAARKSVVLATDFASVQALRAITTDFRAGGYRIEAAVLGVDAARSQRGVLGRALDAHQRRQRFALVPAAQQRQAYLSLRATVQAIELEQLVHSLRIVRRDGSATYSNRIVDDKWVREPTATWTLDAERDRPKTPASKASNAVAWHQLTARAQRAKDLPQSVIDQAVTWRKEASAEALADPTAAKQYQGKLAAAAFRTMPRERFVREFPSFIGALERLDKAVEHAKAEYAIEENRTTFVAGVRERIAQQIETGRQFTRLKSAEPAQKAGPAKSRDDPQTR